MYVMYVCMHVCMYVCMSLAIAQVLMRPLPFLASCASGLWPTADSASRLRPLCQTGTVVISASAMGGARRRFTRRTAKIRGARNTGGCFSGAGCSSAGSASSRGLGTVASCVTSSVCFRKLICQMTSSQSSSRTSDTGPVAAIRWVCDRTSDTAPVAAIRFVCDRAREVSGAGVSQGRRSR